MKVSKIAILSIAVFGALATVAWQSRMLFLVVAPSAPLHEASFRGDVNKIEELLRGNSGSKNLLDSLATFRKDARLSTITPLMWAVRGGHDDAVRLLLDHGADPNRHDEWGRSALQLAAGSSRFDIAERLVKAGANVDHLSTAGESSLTVAIKRNDVAMVEMLVREGANISDGRMAAMSIAARQGSPEIVRLLAPSIKLLASEHIIQLRHQARRRDDAAGPAVVAVLDEFVQ